MVPGGRVGDHLGDDERADPARPAVHVAWRAAPQFGDAADAAADDDAATERIFLGEVEPAVLDRLVGGDQGELGEAVESRRSLGSSMPSGSSSSPRRRSGP